MSRYPTARRSGARAIAILVSLSATACDEPAPLEPAARAPEVNAARAGGGSQYQGEPAVLWGRHISGGSTGSFAAQPESNGGGAALFKNKKWSSIGTPPGYSQVVPEDTNDQDWVVGWVTSSVWYGGIWRSTDQAYVYRPGLGWTPLSDVGANSRARAVNNEGVIVGDVATERPRGDLEGTNGFVVPWPLGTGASRLPFRLSPGGQVEWLDLPYGATEGYAFDINDFGTAVGEVVTSMGRRAYLWKRNGTGAFLSALPNSEWSTARAISSAGTIVGAVGEPQVARPTIWSLDGTYNTQIPLNDAVATDINDDGIVVGVGNHSSGVDWGFVYEAGGPAYLPRTMYSGYNYDFVLDVRIDDCGAIMAEGEALPVGARALFRWARPDC